MSAYLTVEDVILIHDVMETAPMIDRGKLEGAVMRPQAGFGDQMLFPSIFSQASVLLHGVCQAHAFLDGNKRTAWISMLTFLARNGLEMPLLSPEDMTDYMVAVATKMHTESDTAMWIADVAYPA